jgi:hypothetical protein
MDSFPIGSVQSWLAVAATTLSPLIALIVGFENRLVAPAAAARSDGRSRAIGGRRGQGRLTAGAPVSLCEQLTWVACRRSANPPLTVPNSNWRGWCDRDIRAGGVSIWKQ